MRVPFYIFVVLFSCCTNVILLEAMVNVSPNAGIFITFCHFAFVSIIGLIFNTNYLFHQRVIPLKKYVFLVITSFLYGTASNYALNFSISIPLHIIFRSGSLIANMILGVIILKRSYSKVKYISVIAITIGLIIVTMASSFQTPPSAALKLSNGTSPQQLKLSDQLKGSFRFMIGVFLLTFALFASALTGIYQELLFKNYGKHPKEAQFYMHFLSLPGFILLSSNIYHQMIIFNASPSITIISGAIIVPILWVYLIFNVITQYFCISSVFVLLSECTSLTVTFVTTLRKFISLVISIYCFGHEFTHQHWTGTALVFIGTILFMDINWSSIGQFKYLRFKRIENKLQNVVYEKKVFI